MEKIPLRLLIVVDSDADAGSFTGALAEYGYQVDCVMVRQMEAFYEQIEGGDFQLILCDYGMKGLDPLQALQRLVESRSDIPLIFVSKVVDEIQAVEAMRLGAADFIQFEHLARLGPVVDRDLSAAESRRQMRLIERFSSSQTEVLEMILAGKPLKLVLEFIAQRTEELCKDSVRCAILHANPAHPHRRVAVGPNLPQKFLAVVGEVPIRSGERSKGAAAAPVLVEDIATHPEWATIKDVALNCGLKSCWAVTVFSSDHQVLGAVSIFRSVVREPRAEEIRWVEAATKLVGIAIEKGKSAEKLCQSEALLQVASNLAQTGAWAVDLPSQQVAWSDQLCEIHEVPVGTIPDLETALKFYLPESRERVRTHFLKCYSEGVPYDFEAEFISAKGRKKWVRSMGTCIRDESGRLIRVQGMTQDITAKKVAELEAERMSSMRRLTEEVSRAAELRYLNQRNALIALAKETRPSGAELSQAIQNICTTTARTLDVERVSIWRYNHHPEAIECLDQFVLSSGIHTSGAVLLAADSPAYFRALSELELIAADDARVDPITREFLEHHLVPTGITSMLDVPIRAGEAVAYVLCCEHVGPPRVWMPDEKTFAVAIANLISLAQESCERALAENEVLRSHQRFKSVAAATNDTIWDWNLETNEFWWNDGHANLFGWSSKQTGETIRAWTCQIHPDDRQRVEASLYAAIHQGNEYWTEEYRFISADGSVSHVLDRGQVIFDDAKKPIRMVGGMTDLTKSRVAEFELMRSHRALRMLSACNEMLIRTTDEKSLLSQACRLAVEIGGYRMAWVGYAMDDNRHRVQPMAHAGEELGYLAEVEITWDEKMPSGVGPVGQAIRGGKTVVFEDVISNSAFGYWLAAAATRGYRSVICLPLCDGDRVFGVMSLYGGEPHAVGGDELKLLEDMANDLAFGITISREKKRRRRIQEVVVNVAQAVSSGTGAEFFALLTQNLVAAMGGSGGIIGRFDPIANSIETLSFVLNGVQQSNVTYNLTGTPCEKVMDGEVCVFQKNLQQQFPEDHFLRELEIEAYAGIPLLHQDGVVAGIMAVFFSGELHDVSLVQSTLKIFGARAASEMDRQQADSRIREQASLLDKARDAILVRDLDHQITFWNKSAERLYGWTAEEAMGRSVLDLIYRDQDAFVKAHAHMLAHEEWSGELCQVNKDGRELSVDSRWTLVRDDKGRPECVFVLSSDISEQRKLEQQFLRAQRIESIGTLAGGIAHDLNNMLAPISMSIELLKMRINDPRSNELLDTIASSAKRGSDMVGQVLSFARGIEGRRVEVRPHQVIREIENILRDTLLRKIELVVDVDRDLWPIHGDPTQLHQVILNLCVNARDAINGEGQITIHARNVEIDEAFAAMNLEAKDGPHVCIEVEDSGEGIAPAIMDKIFDPFFTTKSVGKGTGLGLSTSLAIVKSHGGFIRTSSQQGIGTQFQIYLPAIPVVPSVLPAATPVRVTKANHSLPTGHGELVLIVDDEVSIRKITQQTLEAFGYRTLLAENGDQAVKTYSIHQRDIDVVLTDMMMPVMDGSVTIEMIKKINPEVKIIATSGITANREVAHSAGRGTKNFLPKPYTAETLLSCLANVLAVHAE
jgi:PAS domain S-box-containing protein